MSLELYSLIPGQQVKRDRDLSNVTIQCDPRAVYPDNESSVNNRFRKREAGKIAVEDDICNLNVANLTVNGQLKLNGEIAAEICNISCPEDFNLRANSSIIEDAGDTFVVTAVNAVDLSTSSVVGGSGNINIGATGFINIEGNGTTAADVIKINTENQNTNAIHLHIPTGTGGAANVGEQINIQNQYNTNPQSVQIKSDLGGIFVDAGTNMKLQLPITNRLAFFDGAGAPQPAAAAVGTLPNLITYLQGLGLVGP